MKLTINLKTCIVQSFKKGDDMQWLANLYKQPLERIEGVIREALKKQEQIGGRNEEEKNGISSNENSRTAGDHT